MGNLLAKIILSSLSIICIFFVYTVGFGLTVQNWKALAIYYALAVAFGVISELVTTDNK